jgi:hypothetical protein
MAAAQPDLSADFETKYLEGWNDIVTAPFTLDKKELLGSTYNQALRALYAIFAHFPEGTLLQEQEFYNFDDELDTLRETLNDAFYYYEQNRRQQGESINYNHPIHYLTMKCYKLQEILFNPDSEDDTQFIRKPGTFEKNINNILKNPQELAQQGGRSRRRKTLRAQHKRKTRRTQRKRKSKSRRRI